MEFYRLLCDFFFFFCSTKKKKKKYLKEFKREEERLTATLKRGIFSFCVDWIGFDLSIASGVILN